jgi:PAS domain S-box-containing protein
MRAWGKRAADGLAGRSVARAATAGATRQELVKEAVAFLLANTGADRIGVWIEAQDAGITEGRGSAAFRGLVADRGSETTFAEWEKLSPEAPLPAELLDARQCVEQELNGAANRAILGALVEMRRALWVPVESRGRLRGVLLAGTRKKGGLPPSGQLMPVAAELACALELEEERQLARTLQGDLAVARRQLSMLASSWPADAVLTDLVASCAETPAGEGGIGAAFAVLRAAEDDAGKSAGPRSEGPTEIVSISGSGVGAATRPSGAMAWWSGDPGWARAMEYEPLAAIWRRAQAARCTIGSEPGVSWPRGEVAHVTAIPLEAAGQPLGVLTVGFRQRETSAAALERLELRAAVAATALLLRRRDAEIAQHAAQQLALLEGSGGAVVLVDAERRVAGWSRGARELLPEAYRNREEKADGNQSSTPRRFVELFRARDQRRVESWLQEADALEAAGGAEGELLEVDLFNGARVRLRCAAPSDGSVAAISLESVAAPDSMRADRAEAQLVNVIEWVEEGVVLFDADHRIRAMNARFAQIAGLAPEETHGVTTLNGLIARLASQAAQPEQFAERWREQARGGDTGVREEIQLLRPVPRVLERAARPMTDPAGRHVGRVEIYRDLTAQRVFQSKLIQTEKLAAIGQMVTGVAHELSNPLTGILGNAQRLLLHNDGAGPSEEVRQIYQEAERASGILRQLLMTARDARPERRKVSLNQVVSRTMELQRFSLAAENIKIELDLDPALPYVFGDLGQLQQVLMNLIGNSRQALEEGGQGGMIRLSTRRVGDRRVLLEVSDNGPGIPGAILSRIFDPFFTTKPAGVGTGLGLSIVLGIVREHGGQVHVASPPRGGATFSLEFPAARSEEGRFSPIPATGPGSHSGERPRAVLNFAPASAATGGPSLASWARARVLVVEDEPTVARLIRDVLEDEGLLVDVLPDGREALERSAREAYDLVICDMKMPEVDGQHVYESLMSTGNPLWRKFLFVTGDVVSAHTHEFLERHQLPHVAKPFRVEELTEKVRRVLAETSPGQPSPALAEKTSAARK